MITSAQHILKARRQLASAQHALAGDFTDAAGRDAYLAAFHAALAFIVGRTGNEPKTHSGTRSEFARLTRDDPRIERRFVTFLANAYELKAWADYDGDEPAPRGETVAALALATEMVELIATLVVTE